MRLRNLRLLRFGHFTDRELTFTEPGKRFHVIYGDNEAGKSTALRAISGLLFGIDERTPDAHLHATKDLRIGAELESDAGDTLTVVRRKGRKDTLLDLDGSAIPESRIHAYTSGTTKDVFEAMFGLNHERLVAGGRDLLAGHGEVGQALFGAAAGLRGLHDLVAQLEGEADAVFKSTGSKPRLNKALKQHQEARKSVRQLALRPSAWATAKRDLEEARKELEGIREEYRELKTRLERRRLLKTALPDAREHEAILARSAELGDVSRLPEDARDQRQNAERILKEKQTRLQKLSDDEQRLRDEDRDLIVPDELLALEARTSDLAGKSAIYLKASKDRTALASKLDTGVLELQELLRQLPVPKTPDEIEVLRIDAASQTRIRDLVREGERLEASAETLRTNARAADDRADKTEEALNALPPAADPTPLQSAVKAARREGDLEANLQSVMAELSGKRESAERLTTALTLWDGSPEDAASLALPLDETIDRFEQDFGEVAEKIRAHEGRKQELDDDLAQLRADIAALESQGNIPTADDLHDRREHRDGLWVTVRRVWLEGAADVRSPGSLAGEYERSIADADSLGDQMFSEHKRVAQIGEHRAREKRIQESLQGLAQEAADLAQHQAQLAETWTQAWEPAGIAPATPREMRAWKGQHQIIAAVVDDITGLQEKASLLRSNTDAHRLACSQLLVGLGDSELDASLGLAAVLEVAEERLAQIESDREKRDRLTGTLTDSAEERRRCGGELATVETDLERWRESWESSIAPLHLPATAQPSEADAVLRKLEEAFTKHAELDGLRERIRHIDYDSRALVDEIESLANDGCPDLPTGGPDVRATELLQRLEAARASRTRRDQIREKLSEIETASGEAQREWEAAGAILTSCVASARVASADELEEAERRSQEIRDLENRLGEVKERLRRTGLPLDDLIAEASEIEEERLTLEIEELSQDLESKEELRDERNQRFANLKRAFEAMDGGAEAATANDEAEEALAQVSLLTSEYALKTAAAVVLRREIQRFAEANQGPILTRASELFQRLTVGRYESISSEFSEKDEAILVCNRASEGAVDVEGLSDGTRDQLYLSLRLAALEHHMRDNESMPLVVDDVLITFDDPRSRATLEAMIGLARSGQILFFTHHRRLVELAEQVIPNDLLAIHEL